MADEEAQNQEQNAEATEAVEAGADAVRRPHSGAQGPKRARAHAPLRRHHRGRCWGYGSDPAQANSGYRGRPDTNGTQGQVQKDGDEKKGGR